MPGLMSIAAALTSQTPLKPKRALLIELDQLGSPVSGFALQYFPESISDGKEVEYASKSIPGASLPLQQWISSGARNIAFSAVFSSDVDLGQNADADAKVRTAGLKARLATVGESARNIDVRAAIAGLRRFMLPRYVSGVSIAPPKIRLNLPGSGIGVTGGTSAGTANDDSIVCVMTSCEAGLEAFFPNGSLRYATVSLSFAQVPSVAGLLRFPARTAQMDAYVQGGALSGGYSFYLPASDPTVLGFK